MEELEKIKELNPITMKEIAIIKHHLDVLNLSKLGAKTITREELDKMLLDFTNFSKKLEEEKNRLPPHTHQKLNEAFKFIAMIVGFLVLLGIIASLSERK